MKNVIATLAMLVLVVVIGFVGYRFMKTPPEPEKKISKALNATEASAHVYLLISYSQLKDGLVEV